MLTALAMVLSFFAVVILIFGAIGYRLERQRNREISYYDSCVGHHYKFANWARENNQRELERVTRELVEQYARLRDQAQRSTITPLEEEQYRRGHYLGD